MEDIAAPAHRLIRGPADAAARDAADRQSHRGRALHGSTEHTPDELTRAARSIPHDPVSQDEFWQCISRHVGAGAILTSPDDLPLLTPCGPLPPASCRAGWNRTHVKPSDPHFRERRAAIRAHCAATPHVWRHALHVCIENPASSALFLFQLGTIALCNITSIQSITHCAGGTPWKKHTRFATTTCTPDYVCGRDPHENCGHGKAHELVSAGGMIPRELDDGMDYTTHFITARHYDDLASAMSSIPLADRQWHPVVHLGAGGESSAHLTVHGFPLVTIDIEECTATHFRDVHPTLCTSYDADTPEGFWAVVDRALAIPGFRRQDVAAYLFDPCCVTRTQLNRVNSVDGEPKNRADCGVPHPGQKGLEARTRDVVDEMIIVALDDEVGRSRAHVRRNHPYPVCAMHRPDHRPSRHRRGHRARARSRHPGARAPRGPPRGRPVPGHRPPAARRGDRGSRPPRPHPSQPSPHRRPLGARARATDTDGGTPPPRVATPRCRARHHPTRRGHRARRCSTAARTHPHAWSTGPPTLRPDTNADAARDATATGPTARTQPRSTKSPCPDAPATSSPCTPPSGTRRGTNSKAMRHERTWCTAATRAHATYALALDPSSPTESGWTGTWGRAFSVPRSMARATAASTRALSASGT